MRIWAGKLTINPAKQPLTPAARRWARLLANPEAQHALMNAIKGRVGQSKGVKNHGVETASTPRFLDHSAKKVV